MKWLMQDQIHLYISVEFSHDSNRDELKGDTNINHENKGKTVELTAEQFHTK